MINVEEMEIILSLKKVMPVIHVIDTSESMTGDGIAAVYEAMYEWEEFLKEAANEIPGAEIKIGVLRFSSGAQWVTKSGFIPLEDFYWEDMQTNGAADLGAALKELDAKLSRKAFLVSETSETGYFRPVIIFMSNGHPTDDWRKALEETNKNNKWFQRAVKIAVAIGDDADTNVLLELVGNIEAVVRGADTITLMRCFWSGYWAEDDLPCITPDNDGGNQDIKTDINSEYDWEDFDWD